MLRNILLAISLAIVLVTSPAKAVPVTMDFAGTISTINDANFNALISVGDSVSGSIVFDTPIGIFITGLTGSSYTVPAGTATGPFPADSSFSGGGIFGKTMDKDPIATTVPGVDIGGGDRVVLTGLALTTTFPLDALTASDFLSLGLGDVDIGLLGWTVFATGGASRAAITAELALTSLSFSRTVPEPATLALMGLGLAVIGYRRKQLKKA